MENIKKNDLKKLNNLLNDKSLLKNAKKFIFNKSKITMSERKNNINYVGNILSIIISGLIVYYVTKLEYIKCNCSASRKRDYLKYFNIIFSLIMLVITGVTYYKDNFTTGKTYISLFNFDYTITLKNIIVIIIFLCSIINVFCVYTYIRELKEKECQCALEANEDIYTFLYYYSLIQLLTLMFFMIIIMMSSLSITY